MCTTGFTYSEAEYNLLGIGVRTSAFCENLYCPFSIGVEVKVISRLLVSHWLLSKYFLLSNVGISIYDNMKNCSKHLYVSQYFKIKIVYLIMNEFFAITRS